MKVECFCIYCKKHPKHDEFKGDSPFVGSWDSWGPEGDFLNHAADVDCFQPESGASDEFNIDLEDYEWESCWYNDGQSGSSFSGLGFTLYAVCGNEINDEDDE